MKNKNIEFPVFIVFEFVSVIIIVILLLLQVDHQADPAPNSLILALFTVGAAIGGVTVAWLIYEQLKAQHDQLKLTGGFNEAQVILQLHADFTQNNDIRYIYEKLEESRNDESVHLKKEDKTKISAYLTFFEAVYYLLNKGILKIGPVNDLFGYRFFLAVHNEDVQKLELIKDAGYYVDIFKLHKELTDYRKGKGEEILNDEHSLNK